MFNPFSIVENPYMYKLKEISKELEDFVICKISGLSIKI